MNARLDRIEICSAAGVQPGHLIGPPPAVVRSAFSSVPGWDGDRAGASDRLAAARARRSQAGRVIWAWLDAVDAECATRCGDTKAALALIDRAESHLRDGDTTPIPKWMDWFTPIRLAAFKGNTQLKAGHHRRARETLVAALDQLPAVDSEQRAVILADLAAVEIAGGDVEQACGHIDQALDQLSLTWYSTALCRGCPPRPRSPTSWSPPTSTR